MKKNNQDSRDNWSGNDRGEKRFDKRNSGFGGDRKSFSRQMFKTTCAACNSSCEVPFKPTGNKPVYCSDCFEKRSSSRDNNRGGGRDKNFSGRPSRNNQNTEQFNVINSKLDKILQLLDPIVLKEDKPEPARSATAVAGGKVEKEAPTQKVGLPAGKARIPTENVGKVKKVIKKVVKKPVKKK